MVRLSRNFQAGKSLESRHPNQLQQHLLELVGERLNFVQIHRSSHQNLIGPSSISNIRVEDTLEASRPSFQNTSMVWRTRWVEFVLDTLFNESVCQNLLIPIEHVVQQFRFTGNKVRPVVGSDKGWNNSPEDKTLITHQQTTGVHWYTNFEMDCASS